MRSVHQKSNDAAAANQQAMPRAAEAPDLDPLGGLQQAVGNRGMLHLLGSIALQSKLKTSQPSDPHEQAADGAAAVQAKRKGPQPVAAGLSNNFGLLLQRKCAACAVGAPCSQCEDEDREEKVQRKATGLLVQRAAREGAEGSPAGVQTPSPSDTTKAAPSFIVEDDALEVKSGQMRKSEFLSQLRTAVCDTAEQALAGTMWSAMGCPYIERWLGHYSKQPSAHLERALRKFAPETASARSAHDYIPLVTQRVRRGIEQWQTTGEVPEVPKEFGDVEMPGATVGGLVGGLLSGVGGAISGFVGGLFSAVGNAVSGLAGGAGRVLSSAAKVMFKHQEGQESEPADPLAVRAQLGNGGALDGRVRSRMQSAFGTDFSGVRVHTDARAQVLNESLSARAFTVGTDIAFAAGEYRPGTPVGDALIAHELAHVVQQGGASGSSGLMQMGDAEPSSLEEDADISAVGAMVSLWGGGVGNLKAMGRSALPSLRAGLKLQRCTAKQTPTPTTTPVKPATPTGPTTSTGPTTTPPSGGPTLPPIMEELGNAGCDPDKGMVYELKEEKIPACMLECARVHEQAHVRYGTKECDKVTAAFKKARVAVAKVEKAEQEEKKDPTNKQTSDAANAARKEADEVLDETEKVVAEYEKWFYAKCRENEGQAYQAGLDACKGAEIEKRCVDTGKGQDYKDMMKDWENFKKNPPNCK